MALSKNGFGQIWQFMAHVLKLGTKFACFVLLALQCKFAPILENYNT